MIFIINKLRTKIKFDDYEEYYEENPPINKNDSMAFGTYIINAV